ncbi:glycosyltransferase [Kordia algicida OT-1]|uniref:Glycosyltransferase n=1 Tax=Kordia algicida OT-1 TaxID=391587 RepID=A9ED16_9FLAO|nr:glycosyltransferase [Kordia algicida]EDP94266.1 Glycosyltransferase [Kordia algicida OT-1]
MLFSAIILSNTKSQSIFDMTLHCMESMIDAEKDNSTIKFEVLLIESNKQIHDSTYKFPDYVKVIIPSEDFNFHAFLNVGIKAASGDFVGLFNNDLIFQKNWFSEILKVKEKHPNVQSFCPVDYDSKFTPQSFFNGKPYVFGYKVRRHIVGWCIIAERKLFNKTGLLDERFSFFYADDDYSLMLQKHGKKHVIVANSEVSHLESKVSKELEKKKSAFFDDVEIPEKDIPKYIYTEQNRWMLERKKLLEGHIIFHKKWGSPKKVAIKSKIGRIFIAYGLGFLNKYFM